MANSEDEKVSAGTVADQTEQEDTLNEPKEDSYGDGVLVGQDVSYRNGKNQNVTDLKDSIISALKDLVQKVSQRDLPARREEILRVWEARLFWHGFQHLLPRRGGGWEFPPNGSGYGREDADSRSTQETNIYTAYGLMLVSALTRAFPTVRFEPINPDAGPDKTAAIAAEKMKKVIAKNNDGFMLLADVGRYLWTDGRAVLYTRYRKDGAKFGFEPTPDDVVPEDIEAVPPATEVEGFEETSGQPIPLKDRKARGAEVITVLGALESKLPIKAQNLCQCPYLQYNDEMDVPTAKATFPDAKDKIKAGAGGPGGDDIDRLARINTRLGVQDHFVTSDSQAYDITVQRTWFRPSAFLEIDDDGIRAELFELFPDGCYIAFAGQIFCEARNESIDDHFEIIHGIPGDGIHRLALGRPLVSVQKRYNNWLDLADDTFIRTIPTKWMDNETFNVEAIKDQTNVPGSIRPFTYMPGTTMDQLIFVEPTIQFPTQLWEAIQEFGGNVPQLLSGVFPAMFGGDTGSNDTGIGIAVQRDQALGRLGLPWRNIKHAFAGSYRQAVICAANNRDEDICISLPGKKGQPDETLLIELQDLKGNVLCNPDSDESFPESWTQRQARFTALVAAAPANPFIAKMIMGPKNQEIVRDGTGLEELDLPDAESFDKQIGEFEMLMRTGPMPNPAIQEMQEKAQQLTQQMAATGQQVDPAVQQATQTQAAALPPMVSTVPIDVECDNHEAEADTCLRWINSPAGRKAKAGTEEEQAGFQNIRQHYLEHKVEVKKAKALAAQAAVPPKPVSTSISMKDLPGPEAAQLAQKAGLQASPNDFGGGQVPPGAPPGNVPASAPGAPPPA